MSQATSANSIVKTFKAGGTINPGHAVYMSAAGTVIQDATGLLAVGVYIGADDAASGDHVPVCLHGPCRAWCDGTSAITVGCRLGSDSSGHVVVDTTDRHILIGWAMEALASGTAYVEIFVNRTDSSHA